MKTYGIILALVLIAIMISLAFASSNMEGKTPISYETTAELSYETFRNRKIIETLTNQEHMNFCKEHVGSSPDLDRSCRNLDKDACLETKCCAYAHEAVNGEYSCVAAKQGRPVYQSSKAGDMFNYDYWYFNGKCNNDKGPPISQLK